MGVRKKEDRFERLRASLLSEEVDRKKKLDILRKLIELKAEPRVSQILREAARAPINGSILKYVVRAFGYMDDRTILGDLAEFVAHRRRSVVTNAVKAAVALDPEAAVRMVLPRIRNASLQVASAALSVLALRCRALTDPAIGEMARSTATKDRVVALVYLRLIPRAEGLEPILEMLRRERDLELIVWELKLLSGMVTRTQCGPLEELHRELSMKITKLRDLLESLPDELEPEPSRLDSPSADEGPQTGNLLPRRTVGSGPAAEKEPPGVGPEVDEPAVEEESGQLEPGEDERTKEKLEGLEDDGVDELEPAQPEALPEPEPVATPPRTRATGRSVPVEPGAGPLLPWQEKERRLRERRTQKNPSMILHVGMQRTATSKALLVGLVLVLGAYLAFHTLGRPGAAVSLPPSSRRPAETISCALGKVGELVKFSGQVAEIHRDYNILLIKTDQGMFASTYFGDPVSSFTVGRQIQVQGTLKEIRSPQVCVVQGSLAREP